MSKDTIDLLKECNAGCKCATNSMEQVQPYLKDGKLKSLIDYYNQEHIKIGEECHTLLNQSREEEKDPTVAAKVYSWISTEIKMMVNSEEAKIADIMVKGCDMGIKSLEKYLNQYQEADSKSRKLTEKLISLEEKFREELYAYL